MTTATQVLALIDSAMVGDLERFRAVSLQVAADASQRGRASFHDSILARLNQRRARRHPTTPELHGVTLAGLPFHSIADGDAVPRELRGALEMSCPDRGAATMTLAPDVQVAMEGLVREREMADDLRAVGLQPATRVMFSGPPGTGKSTGAAALAADLGWPLLSVKMHGVIREHLGETASMLAKVLAFCRTQRAVVFVDEADSIGATRSAVGGDAGREMSRTVNTLLVLFDEFERAEGLLVAATNMPEHIDPALWRRFDAIVEFPLPSADLLERAMRAALQKVDTKAVAWPCVAAEAAAHEHSFATAIMACRSAAKRAVLGGSRVVTADSISQELWALRPVKGKP